MIVNGYCIKQNLNGHDYIEFVNSEIIYPEADDQKYWYNLFFSIKDILPDYEKAIEEFWDGSIIDTFYGEIKINFNKIYADGNNELIKKIANLLEESNYFSKISRNDCSEKHHCKWCSDDVV